MYRLGGYTIASTVAATDYLPLIKTAEGLGANDAFKIRSITIYSTTDTTVKIHNTFVPLIAEVPLSSEITAPQQIKFGDDGKAVKIAFAY